MLYLWEAPHCHMTTVRVLNKYQYLWIFCQTTGTFTTNNYACSVYWTFSSFLFGSPMTCLVFAWKGKLHCILFDTNQSTHQSTNQAINKSTGNEWLVHFPWQQITSKWRLCVRFWKRGVASQWAYTQEIGYPVTATICNGKTNELKPQQSMHQQ